jgi:hypothetical protein
MGGDDVSVENRLAVLNEKAVYGLLHFHFLIFFIPGLIAQRSTGVE